VLRGGMIPATSIRSPRLNREGDTTLTAARKKIQGGSTGEPPERSSQEGKGTGGAVSAGRASHREKPTKVYNEELLQGSPVKSSGRWCRHREKKPIQLNETPHGL